MFDISNVKVFCIIVTYNAMKWIDSCLLSQRESSVRLHPIVVDNNSTDGTLLHILREYPEVVVIQNKENKGFGQANNQGIEYAYKNGATHFFLLNQDAKVFPNTIGNLLTILERHQLSAVSPVHLNGTANELDFGFYNSTFVNQESLNLPSDLILGRTKEYYLATKTVCAAAWLLSRNTIDSIGGFDPLFFHYGEDDNYFQRLIYHNKTFGIVPNAFICHNRVFHGNIDVFNSRKTEQRLLYTRANINFSKGKLNYEMRKEHMKNLKALCVELFHFRLSNIRNILKGYTHYINKINMAKNSRIVNAKIGSNWLSL